MENPGKKSDIGGCGKSRKNLEISILRNLKVCEDFTLKISQESTKELFTDSSVITLQVLQIFFSKKIFYIYKSI